MCGGATRIFVTTRDHGLSSDEFAPIEIRLMPSRRGGGLRSFLSTASPGLQSAVRFCFASGTAVLALRDAVRRHYRRRKKPALPPI